VRRHEATKAEIVAAAWEVAREKGLAGLTLGDVAARVGMRVPSLYSYFASKNDIVDAMFAQGNDQFLACIRSRRAATSDPPATRRAATTTASAVPSRLARQRLREAFRTYFEFCVADPVRYQLLFQRTIPGFVPSDASYAKAVEVLALLRQELAEVGLVGDQADEDLLTALSSGLVDQQIANDPGGDRWARLVDEVADMAYDHIVRKRRRKLAGQPAARTGRARGPVRIEGP